MDSAHSSVHIVQTDRQIRDRGTELLDVCHRPLEKLPCVLLLEIFALGRWLLTGGLRASASGYRMMTNRWSAVICVLVVGVETP